MQLMKLILTAAILALTATFAQAASVSIAWNPPIPSNNVTGYKIYHGFGSRDYVTNTLDTGLAQTGTVARLDPTLTYYFAVTAYNVYSNESEYSVELVWDNTAPVITGPESLTLDLPAGADVVLPDFRSLFAATDNFTPSDDIEITQEPPPGSPALPGMVIAFLAVDEAGNTGRLDRVLGVTITLTPKVGAVRGEGSNGITLQINEEAK